MNILLMENNKELCIALMKLFAKNGIDCDVAHDGTQGLNMATICNYDVIMLDLLFPEMSALEVLKAIRKRSINTPVLVLTARNSIEDMEESYSAEADDFIVMPLEYKELLLRINALVRRSRANALNGVLAVGKTKLNVNRQYISINGKPVKLSNTAAKLLETLVKNKGNYVSKETLLNTVWGVDKMIQASNVEVYINMLRKNLPAEQSGFAIQTKYGLGYRIIEQ